MIYKTLKKVSEYCQLLDKSKFPATKTENGVTWTNNGDGTITVDGTATGLTTYIFGKILFKSNRKYLYCGLGNSTNVLLVYNLFYSDGSFYKSETTNSSIIIDTASIEKGALQVFAKRNNNIPTSGIVKPQLFDLTEMYGAGNEPITVEQFRTKFPNELYDYKPYCFVKSYKTLLKAADDKIITSYKKSLICTTNNLFDSEDWYNTLHAINSTSMTKETVNGIEYYKFIPQDIYDYEYMKGQFKENTSYTLSFLGMNKDGSDNKYTGLRFYYTDGTRDSYYINTGEEQKHTITSSSNKTIDSIQLSYNAGKYVLVSNIQLEKGSTATEYHPYGYL